MTNTYYVYMMTNRPNGTLYVGVTSDLSDRVQQHKLGVFEGFTRRYKLHRLVWYETFGDIEEAIRREKRLKTWLRAWKVTLVWKSNPDWLDLAEMQNFS